jgi:hypothetical protein
MAGSDITLGFPPCPAHDEALVEIIRDPRRFPFGSRKEPPGNAAQESALAGGSFGVKQTNRQAALARLKNGLIKKISR